MKQKIFRPQALIALLLCAGLLAGCASGPSDAGQTASPEATEEVPSSVPPEATGFLSSVTVPEFSPASSLTEEAAVFSQEDLEEGWSESEMQTVLFEGDSISFSGTGASVDGTTLTIAKAGVYVLSGALTDGSVHIEAGKNDTVRLILNGVSLHCSNSAPLYASKGKVILTLAEGTENSLTDGAQYAFADGEDEPSAALFSKDDLTINGSGALLITAAYRDGITCRDTLRLVNGSLSITAADDGIVGRDAFLMCGGNLTISASGDGIKASNDSDAEKGFVALTGGTVAIVAKGDGIQAETAVLLCGGSLTATAGGGSAAANSAADSGSFRWNTDQNSSEDAPSTKAVKAGSHILVSGGALQLDSLDDALHSNGTILLSGGEITLSSGDDGIHADSALSLTGGQVSILQSYEGLESALILLSGGSVLLSSQDDGINIAGGNNGTISGGRMQDPFGSMDGTLGDSLYITGGSVYVNAAGDGIDVNGSAYITGGLVLVDGPSDSGNGALDYNGEFLMLGGTLIAAGSSGMSQAPSGGSQKSLIMTFSSNQQDGTLIHLGDASGASIAAYSPSKPFSSIVISSPSLTEGTQYTLSVGGSSTGTLLNGYYDGGDYTPGESIVTFPLDSTVTYVNESGVTEGGSFGGRGGFGGRGNGGFGGWGQRPDGKQDGTPPERPGSDQGSTPPERPDGEQSGTPPIPGDAPRAPDETPFQSSGTSDAT